MKTIILIFLAALSGCASIVDGSQQSLSVQTSPEIGAQCTLTNNKGSWIVPATPAVVTVHRSGADMNVRCVKDQHIGNVNEVSFAKGAVFGNILAGGLIGWGVDATTGAAYDYPSMFTVPMN